MSNEQQIKRKKNKRSGGVPRGYFLLFLALGGLFIIQMAWWIIFFIDLVELEPKYFRMLVFEGLFFIILIIIGLFFIYRVLRQSMLQQQHFKDFFAGFSHELKTPLASMKLQVETLERLQLPEEKRKKLLGAVLEDIDRLELTLENILDVFRLEAGRTSVDMKVTDIDTWLRNTIESLIRAHGENSMQITWDLQSQASVYLDDRYFHSVVANLVQNAARYSNGRPQLTVVSRQRDEQVFISFSDSGIGFPPEAAEDLFEKYTRMETSNGKRHKGAGLGLFISRQIANSHGGSLTATSDGEGTGATFTITLPMAGGSE